MMGKRAQTFDGGKAEFSVLKRKQEQLGEWRAICQILRCWSPAKPRSPSMAVAEQGPPLRRYHNIVKLD